MKRLFAIIFFGLNCFILLPQNLREQYNSFNDSIKDEYYSFRKRCNERYAEFLKEAWESYEASAPIPAPKDNITPPRPYKEEEKDTKPIVVSPEPIKIPEIPPQPKPIEPVREIPQSDDDCFKINFYGVTCKVRLPKSASAGLKDVSNNSLAEAWSQFSSDNFNNAIRDCLETRIRYNLSDWAYLLFLEKLATEFCSDKNDATLLMAFLYCQSGYQMRLAVDNNKLLMLFGSRHRIYNKGFFNVDGTNFYPYKTDSYKLQICNAKFEGESPLSLIIAREQLLGQELSKTRNINSGKLEVNSCVPIELISFYEQYPTSEIGNNKMTRWAMYANVPLAQATKDILYPVFKSAIKDLSQLEAVNLILNWIQKGFEYEYDDKVWGYDRAFFAEETLYYPYADCEDRAILFSRLVRDLTGLDVALLFYPGHLATAVAFDNDINGDAMIIDGRKFTVCDPTYIGAPVGKQMPNLDYDKTQAIILDR